MQAIRLSCTTTWQIAGCLASLPAQATTCASTCRPGRTPGGTYYFYDFTTPTFPDYPKYAVWPDAYYVSSNETNPTAYALNRTRMLSGLSATFQRFTAPSLSGFGFQSLIPADLDGATPPPAGAPGLFMRHRDTEVHGPAGYPNQDILETYAFHVDWTTPANSTFTKTVRYPDRGVRTRRCVA